jgi:hypothetical protein
LKEKDAAFRERGRKRRKEKKEPFLAFLVKFEPAHHPSF